MSVTIEQLQQAGRAAWDQERPAAPALDPTVREALTGLAVGDPRSMEVMRAFEQGWHAAADEAINRMWREVS